MDYSSLTQSLNTLLPFVSVELDPDFSSALSLPYCNSLEQNHLRLFNFVQGNFCFDSHNESPTDLEDHELAIALNTEGGTLPPGLSRLQIKELEHWTSPHVEFYSLDVTQGSKRTRTSAGELFWWPVVGFRLTGEELEPDDRSKEKVKVKKIRGQGET